MSNDIIGGGTGIFYIQICNGYKVVRLGVAQLLGTCITRAAITGRFEAGGGLRRDRHARAATAGSGTAEDHHGDVDHRRLFAGRAGEPRRHRTEVIVGPSRVHWP